MSKIFNGWWLFWDEMVSEPERITTYVIGILFGVSLELGSFFGYQYPCIGWLFDGVINMYYLILYILYIFLGGMQVTALIYATLPIIELSYQMSLNWCAKGIMFTWEDLYERESPNTYHTPNDIAYGGKDSLEDEFDTFSFASAAEYERHFAFDFGDISAAINMSTPSAIFVIVRDSIFFALTVIVDFSSMVDFYAQRSDFFNPGMIVGKLATEIACQIAKFFVQNSSIYSVQ